MVQFFTAESGKSVKVPFLKASVTVAAECYNRALYSYMYTNPREVMCSKDNGTIGWKGDGV